MRKRIFIAAILLLVGFSTLPMSLSSQTRQGLTGIDLSRMDLLSRAALFERLIADAARKEGVDPKILWTIAYNETRFRPWLTSPKNAKGLMQFMPATAVRFGLSDPYEPNASIRAAARYVKYLNGLFGGRLDSVLAAYNAGEGTVLAYLHGRTLLANGKIINPTGLRRVGGVPPYRETTNYVVNGRRIYRWPEAQGRFRGVTPGADLNTSSEAATSHEERSDEKGDSETSTLVVLYDPRTGQRSRVDRFGKLQPFETNAPVIISPEVRGLPAQKARSTFAGITP